MLVNIIQCAQNDAHLRRGRDGNTLVMRQKAADNDIDIALFNQLRIGVAQMIERLEMGEQAAVELCVVEVRGQGFRLEDAQKVVGIPLADNQHVVDEIGRGCEGVRGAFSGKDQLVFFCAEFFLAHFAVNRSVGDVDQFDATVKMHEGVVVRALEKFYFIRFVVKCFVKDVFFHRCQYSVDVSEKLSGNPQYLVILYHYKTKMSIYVRRFSL